MVIEVRLGRLEREVGWEALRGKGGGKSKGRMLRDSKDE